MTNQVEENALGIPRLEASCLIASSHPVNRGYFDSSSDFVYSIDMIRLKLKINPNQVEEFEKLIDTWTLPDRAHRYYANKIGGYRFLWNLVFEDSDSSISIGLALIDGKGKTDSGVGFIEFNPNKVGKEGVALIQKLLAKKARLEPVRFDLAIDYNVDRNSVRLIKDGRKYGCVMSESFTEYLGRRSKIGFAKVYDKQVESDLEYACTRVELTCDALWNPSEILNKLPKVFSYSSPDFDNLKRTTKAFAIAVQAHIANGDTLEPWLALCNPETRTKLRKAFGKQQALSYNVEAIRKAIEDVKTLSDGSWVATGICLLSENNENADTNENPMFV